jgi:hypothetical protein
MDVPGCDNQQGRMGRMCLGATTHWELLAVVTKMEASNPFFIFLFFMSRTIPARGWASAGGLCIMD